MSFAIVAAGVGAVGGIAGGIIQGNAASDAAKKQQDAASQANALQERMYNQTRADQEPWRQAGATALGQLGSQDFQRDFNMSDFQKDPGYDFRMQQGQQALERSAAARGGLNSGATLGAISRYGQDYASNEYQNAYNRFNNDRNQRFSRLSSIAGMGQGANSALGQAGQNYAGQYGANTMDAAVAAGNAGMASAQGWANTLGGLGKMGMDMYANNKWSDMFKPQTSVSPSAPSGAGGMSVSGYNYSQSPLSFFKLG